MKDIFEIEKEFEKIRNHMDQLMSNFFSDSFKQPTNLLENPLTKQNNNFLDFSFKTPATDLYEQNNEIIAKIEIPGINKDNIKLEVKNQMLHLTAENKTEKEEKEDKKGYYKIERSYTGFSRTIPLPVEVEEENISATYKDGILTIHMPKKKTDSNKKIKYINID